MPLRVGKELLGWLQPSPVFLEEKDPGIVGRIQNWTQDDGIGGNLLGSVDCRIEGIKTVGHSEYEAALSMLEIFARLLGDASNRLALTQSPGETIQIVKARGFITDNID